VVLDHESGPVRFVAEANFDSVRGGVLANVRQRFLGYPVQSELAVARKVAILSHNHDPTRNAGIGLEVVGQVGELRRSRQVLVVKRRDRPPGFVESGLRQAVRAAQSVLKLAAVHTFFGHEPGAFEIQDQTRQ
jgi:hypothetical protein